MKSWRALSLLWLVLGIHPLWVLVPRLLAWGNYTHWKRLPEEIAVFSTLGWVFGRSIL